MNISLTIAAHNAARTLGRAIDSVLHQSVPVTEIVLVDDGSTDGTAEIAQKYGTAVRCFHYENAGLSVARNRGISHATSEWIAFLDADDEWLPHFVASHRELVARHPEVRWTYCHREDVMPSGRRCMRIPQAVEEQMVREGTVSYYSAALAGFYFGTCGFMIRRSVFDELGYFNPAMRNGMDGDMWRRIALRYGRVAVCGDVCWRYHRDDPRSLHHKGRWCRDLQMKSLCDAMRRAMEFGPEVVNEYSPYGRMLVMRDLMREAARDCSIESDIIEDARSTFALSVRERGLLRVLRLLPKAIAVRVVDRLVVF